MRNRSKKSRTQLQTPHRFRGYACLTNKESPWLLLSQLESCNPLVPDTLHNQQQKSSKSQPTSSLRSDGIQRWTKEYKVVEKTISVTVLVEIRHNRSDLCKNIWNWVERKFGTLWTRSGKLAFDRKLSNNAQTIRDTYGAHAQMCKRAMDDHIPVPRERGFNRPAVC